MLRGETIDTIIVNTKHTENMLFFVLCETKLRIFRFYFVIDDDDMTIGQKISAKSSLCCPIYKSSDFEPLNHWLLPAIFVLLRPSLGAARQSRTEQLSDNLGWMTKLLGPEREKRNPEKELERRGDVREMWTKRKRGQRQNAKHLLIFS